MAYAQFSYQSYTSATPHQMLSVATGGPVNVSVSCGSPRGLSSPSPQTPVCTDSAIVTPAPGSVLNRAPSTSPSPPCSTTASSVVQAAAYESRLLSTAYHHPSIHSVHHSHHHPRLAAAGFYGTAGGSGTGSATISYATETATNGYGSLGSVDSSAFYPTLGSGFGMKEDPWRATLSSSTHPATHQTTAPYYYDATHLAAYGYGGLDFNGARRKNVTRDSTTTLKAWLGEHRKNPYPTKGEKIMLAIITKMTLTQVSTWFANARRRLKKENKMTWEPRNKVETEDHQADDSQNDSRRSDDEDRKPVKEPMLTTKQERMEKEESKSNCSDVNVAHDLEGIGKRNEEYDDRSRSLTACLSRTHSLDSSDASVYRNRTMINENQNGSRLSTLSLHGTYPGSVINDFPGSCLQLPFSSVPTGASSFRAHHSPILSTDPLIPTVSQYNNRYQVSPEHQAAISLSTASAFTPSTTSSSEGDSQDLLTCNALDAFIKDASLSSSSSGESNPANSPMQVSDNSYSPVITKPKIWSLAATATSKSPPPNLQLPSSSQQPNPSSCAKFQHGEFLPNQSYQKHCQLNHRETFANHTVVPYPSSCTSDNWYSYPTRQQQNHTQFQEASLGTLAHHGQSGFHGRTCYSPSPPQTDTPPQTPPSLKVAGHQLNNYGPAGDHQMYGNYTQNQIAMGKSSMDESAKSLEVSMLACDGQPQSREISMEKRMSMENALEAGSSLDVGGDYQQLSLSEDDSSSPCAASASGHRGEAVHGVTALTTYRNCFGGEAEFEIP